MSELQIGILGAGFMGRTHAELLKSIPGVTVTGIVSEPRETAVGLKEAVAPSATVFESVGAMLDGTALNALYVCLPPFAHGGELELAAARGVAVFVEKPIALTVARAESMANAVREGGVISHVGYHMRYMPAVREVARLIADGTAGRPLTFAGGFFCNSLHSPWWRDKSKSGGQVFEQLIHTYNMAQGFLGKAKSVSAFCSNLCHQEVDGYTVEDTSTANIRFANGGVASIVGSNCAIPMRWTPEAMLICERMTATNLSGEVAKIVLHDGEQVVEEYEILNDSDPYLEESKQFVAALRGDDADLVPVADGLADIRLVAATIESAEHGGAIQETGV